MKNTIEGYLIGPNATIREAMSTIDIGRRQVALVVDETQHLLGTVTDGDIRRSLLLGTTLEAPISAVMNGNPTVITRVEGLEKAQKNNARKGFTPSTNR
jgi:CBS domain-containing protein